jgi:hypothetical protein
MLDWLGELVAPLNAVAFHLLSEPVSWAELLGFVFGLTCVYLVVRANVHNFWTGILNSAMFLVLFLSARLGRMPPFRPSTLPSDSSGGGSGCSVAKTGRHSRSPEHLPEWSPAASSLWLSAPRC